MVSPDPPPGARAALRAGLTARVTGLLSSNRVVAADGRYTRPARRTYPHQWLWDSCFHAIVRRRGASGLVVAVDPGAAGRSGGGHDACSKAVSLASTAAPVTPARLPSSDSTTGRLPVASGSERR